ncbi:hypothetical protein D3C83_131230 [compost metagenome]
MSAPPSLKFQIARHFGINLRIQIVLLGPQRVRRILILEILNEPRAVKFSAAQIADKRRQPTAAEQAAAVSHRVFAADARPI